MDDLPPLPDGPHDLEFFFDAGCPFAWMTSRWVLQVVEATGISVGWRFISLKMINEDSDLPESYKAPLVQGLRFHRICAAARDRFGNDAVGRLYTAYGSAFWYQTAQGGYAERMEVARAAIDFAAFIEAARLPADLVDAADDGSWDVVIRAESDAAFERTGPDVGTPIITFVESGHSVFGPVISSLPDPGKAVEIYDAVKLLVDWDSFSELKRTKRPHLELPILTS